MTSCTFFYEQFYCTTNHIYISYIDKHIDLYIHYRTYIRFGSMGPPAHSVRSSIKRPVNYYSIDDTVRVYYILCLYKMFFFIFSVGAGARYRPENKSSDWFITGRCTFLPFLPADSWQRFKNSVENVSVELDAVGSRTHIEASS